MTDIELVVKMPEEEYKIIKNYTAPMTWAERLIKNGTPLPKGHGRLIDVNDLLDDISLEDNDYNRDVNVGEIITLENIDRIPTIIEADREGEQPEK